MELRAVCILGLALALGACASAPTRAPSSENGLAGNEGQGGEAGNDGQQGTAVVAVGCAGYIEQGTPSLDSSDRAEHWLSIVEYMCGKEPTGISPEVLTKAHRVLDYKVAHLAASGYVNRPRASALAEIPVNFDGLRQKVEETGKLFEVVEKEAGRDYGCFPVKKLNEVYRVCFQTTFRYITAEGTPHVQMEVSFFRASNDSLETRERTALAEAPALCANGTPRFDVRVQESSRGQKYMAHYQAGCDEIDFDYSGFYPSLRFTY